MTAVTYSNTMHACITDNMYMYICTLLTDQQTDFGCFSQLITLWCFDGGVINVTDAYYGQYSESCDGECCMPDQVDDCRVSVLDNRPSDWVGLKLTCDNRTSCSYEYLGSAIDECEENYLADYMQIYYDCGAGKS